MVKDKLFRAYEITHILRDQNTREDAISKLPSTRVEEINQYFV